MQLTNQTMMTLKSITETKVPDILTHRTDEEMILSPKIKLQEPPADNQTGNYDRKYKDVFIFTYVFELATIAASEIDNTGLSVAADGSPSAKKLMWRKMTDVVLCCGKIYDLAIQVLGSKTRDKLLWRCPTGGSPVKVLEDVYVGPGGGHTMAFYPAQVTVQMLNDPFDVADNPNSVDLQTSLWKVDSHLLVDVTEHIIRTDDSLFWLFGMDHATGSNQLLAPRAVIKAPAKQTKIPTILGKPYIDLRIMDALRIKIKTVHEGPITEVALYVAGFCFAPGAGDACNVSVLCDKYIM